MSSVSAYHYLQLISSHGNIHLPLWYWYGLEYRGLSFWLVGPLGSWKLSISFGTCKVPVSGEIIDLHSQICTCLPSHVWHLEWDLTLDVGPRERPEASPAIQVWRGCLGSYWIALCRADSHIKSWSSHHCLPINDSLTYLPMFYSLFQAGQSSPDLFRPFCACTSPWSSVAVE